MSLRLRGWRCSLLLLPELALEDWLVVVRYIFSSEPEKIKGEDTLALSGIKKEEETDEGGELNLSDIPRTFPTYGRQKPLRYESTGRDELIGKVKDEDSEEFVVIERASGVGEADDKDEDEDEDEEGEGEGFRGVTDSGIGTSFSEGGERGSGSVKRRRERGGRI
ncbi:hypothetical protein DL95DRAFT_483586 [Leptodontidium sp. 2 PMI_412]|nr:hypothetical protein DL95DRAFT_483586 [Leptodontidium sp. 2 PMI_412]